MIESWMESIVALSGLWLALVLMAAWRTLPIFILVAGIDLVFSKRLAPSFRALLWTLVIIRLLLPISFATPWSLQQPFDELLLADASVLPHPDLKVRVLKDGRHVLVEVNEEVFAIDNREQAISVETIVPNSGSDIYYLPGDSASSVNQRLVPKSNIPAYNVANSDDEPRQLSEPVPPTFDWSIVVACAGTLLAVVSICLILRGLLIHIRFAYRLCSCRELNDTRVIDLLLRECDSLGVGRRPFLREVPFLETPAVFGLFRKTICLPLNLADTLSDQEFRWILRHELAHLRRRDIPISVLASLAVACHWFNPLVWLVARRLRTAMEAAADRVAVQGSSQSELSVYGELLLRFAPKQSKATNLPALGWISFATGRHFKHRIESVLRGGRRPTLLPHVLAVLVIMIMAVLGLTDTSDTIVRKIPSERPRGPFVNFRPRQIQQFDAFRDLERPTDGSNYREQYIVESILQSMPESITASDASGKDQLMTWLQLPHSLYEALQLEGTVLSANLNTAQHQRLKTTLELWAHGPPQQVVLEGQIIQTTNSAAGSIDWSGQRIEGLTISGAGPALAARVKNSDLKQWMATAATPPDAKATPIPTITLFNGQTSFVADQTQRTFVTDIRVKVDGSIDPVLSVVDCGLKIISSPIVESNGGLALSFQLSMSELEEVSEVRLPIRYLDGKVHVQVPKMQELIVSSTVTLAADESILVAIPQVNKQPLPHNANADETVTVIVALSPSVVKPAR